MTTKPTKKTVAARRAEIAKRMHVPKINGGYHVLEIPGRAGEPYEFWPGPFRTELGAKLFLDVLVDCYVVGEPEQALDYSNGCEGYDEQAGVLAFLERHDDVSDKRFLAHELCRVQPWNGTYFDEDAEIPF